MADNKSAGVEVSAISLLKEAVTLDSARNFSEALVCYREGIQLLLVVVRATTDATKKQRFTEKITEYMTRAETLKKYIEHEKEAIKVHEEIDIADNATGYSYERIFSKCLDATVTEVEIEDPYIRHNHQMANLLRFCELMVKSEAPVRVIKLTTAVTEGADNVNFQSSKLKEIEDSLKNYSVNLFVKYSDNLHDRQVRFNNGWIVKLGRGLDYFKAAPSKFAIGFYDYDLRPCHKTSINIFHQKYTKATIE